MDETKKPILVPPGPPKRRTVGDWFRKELRERREREQASGEESPILQLLEERKNIIRKIQGLDPETQAAEIEALHKEAEEILEKTEHMPMSLKDAYALAYVK